MTQATEKAFGRELDRRAQGLAAPPRGGRPPRALTGLHPMARAASPPVRMRSVPLPPQGAPPVKKQNLAARAGRWSAQHRKKAVFGWLAFVIAATLIGGSLGTKTIPSDEEGLAGDAKRAHEIVKDTFPQAAGEQVFIQSKTAARQTPAYRAAVKDVEQRLAAQKNVTNIQSPYAKENAGQISRDGHSVARDLRDQGRLGAGRGARSTRSSPPPPPPRRRTPSCASSSSATPAPARPSRRCSRTTSRRPRRSRCRSRW